MTEATWATFEPHLSAEIQISSGSATKSTLTKFGEITKLFCLVDNNPFLVLI